MQITIHRGTHQIGGCVTSIRSKNTRIIIDIGEELPSSNKVAKKEFQISGVTTGDVDCDGIFVSHYHGDHIGMFNKILDGIPIYMGNIAHKVFLNLREHLNDENINTIKTFKTFNTLETIEFSDMTVTPYRVDHSAYDSYMFLIETEGKRVLHTGDFRTHGWTGKGLWSVLDKYIKNVDILITEGTMLSRNNEEVLTEAELCNRANKLMRDNRNVFVLCSSTNFDSIASFYKAALDCGKLFVCDSYQRSNLDIVSETAKSDLYRMKKAKIYFDNRNDCLEDMKKRGFCMLVRANKSFENVLKMFPDSLFIYSMWQGYLKDGHARDEKIYNFIPKDEHDNLKYLHLHTSGHATKETIIDLCKKLEPKIIIPIHSENPEIFNEFDLPYCNIKILTDMEPYDL